MQFEVDYYGNTEESNEAVYDDLSYPVSRLRGLGIYDVFCDIVFVGHLYLIFYLLFDSYIWRGCGICWAEVMVMS